MKNNLGLRSYKIVIEPLLFDDQKIEREKKFANWVRTNFREEVSMRIFFSAEKFFDIDRVYNSRDDRVRVADRADADEKDGIEQRRKFP